MLGVIPTVPESYAKPTVFTAIIYSTRRDISLESNRERLFSKSDDVPVEVKFL